MLLAGVDISTVAIHVALIPLDHDAKGIPPVTFRTVKLPQTRGADPLYRRVERARAMRHAVAPLFLDVDGYEVHLAYVEEPRGRFRNDALAGCFDSVCTAIPPGIIVSGIQPMAWRAELGLPRKLSKQDAISEARIWLLLKVVVADLTEHQAEALLVALAGRQINDRHFRSAA